MAYKYEESNKQIIYTVDNESSMDKLNERINELQEVYRKARAFDEILNIEDNYFDKYDEPITAEEFLCEFDFILDNHERNESADDER